MNRIIKFFSFLFLSSLFIFLNTALASSELNSQFVIVYKMPPSIPWTIIKDEQDSSGYLKVYQPETSDGSDQWLNINYGKNIRTSLRDSMKEVLAVQAKAPCQQKQAKIIAEKDNYFIFTTSLAQCRNGKALKEIYKTFNMPDGQYFINYVADPTKIDAETIARMQNMVKTAKIVPLSH